MNERSATAEQIPSHVEPDADLPATAPEPFRSLSLALPRPIDACATERACAAHAPRLLNRELSWLEFNARVLSLFADRELPLLERVKFAAIFATNLDEFFQVRVAGLQAQVDAGVEKTAADGRTAAEQLRAIRERVLELCARHEDVMNRELWPALAGAGLEIVHEASLTEIERKDLAERFEREIFPALTPLCVDPAHPFPYISNLSLNIAALVEDPSTGKRRFARIKVPGMFPRFISLRDGTAFLPIEELISAHLSTLLPGVWIHAHALFRVTLDANLDVNPERAEAAEDLLAAIETGLYRRLRMNDAVRLEVSARMPDVIRSWLCEELGILSDEVYACRGLIGAGSLWELNGLDRPELKYPAWAPVTPLRLMRDTSDPRALDLFAAIRSGDLLVHHPYDSFGSSVEAFLERAANDPEVIAIKTTMYRTSGRESPIAQALIRAAKAGKEVVALIELRARFDERPNIEWARYMEQAGVHVVYGLVGLKTHGKTALVVRRESGVLRRYCHLGTGNYNPGTAKIYEDLGLFTARAETGADVGELFNYLTGVSRPQRYRELLVAPLNLRAKIVGLIHEQMASRSGRIVMKLNSLEDAGIIEALYEASCAGVEIDLIVRGICCLVPGVPGRSERIRVRSIVGRFLEHSRIYRFGDGLEQARYFFGSADMMVRNLDRRVEILVPVEDRTLRARIDEILAINLNPDARAWLLGPEGRWSPSGGTHFTQTTFMEMARARVEG
jgi:polyphosphate kinase